MNVKIEKCRSLSWKWRKVNWPSGTWGTLSSSLTGILKVPEKEEERDRETISRNNAWKPTKFHEICEFLHNKKINGLHDELKETHTESNYNQICRSQRVIKATRKKWLVTPKESSMGQWGSSLQTLKSGSSGSIYSKY